MRILPILGAAIIFCGCAAVPAAEQAASNLPPVQPAHSAESALDATATDADRSGEAPQLPDANSYIEQYARALALRLRGDVKEEPARAALYYRYLIENVYFALPVGTEVWQYRCNPDAPPGYLHARALGPLLNGIGSCEDFAAALTLLLRADGIQAEYVSGLVLSAEGDFVDHAWTVARIDGQWYHLDSQLEQNIVRGGKLTWRYFLREDAFMLADHRWGAQLADYWGSAVAEETRALLRTEMAPPACERPGAQPPPCTVVLPDRPDVTPILRAVESERVAWELAHGETLPAYEVPPAPLLELMPVR